MRGLDDIIKSNQWAQNINKSLGLSSQVSEMLRRQEKMTKSFDGPNSIIEFAKVFQQHERTIKSISGVSMITELAKGMHQKMASNHTLSAIDKFTKPKLFTIPQPTLDAITSINRIHDRLFGNLRTITEVVTRNQSAISQINSLQFAISGVSGQLASIAAAKRKWDLIDYFEDITEDAVSLNERIFDENGVTYEGLNELKEFFHKIENKVNKIDVDANAPFWKLLTLLGFVLAIMGEARNWLPKPEYATKQEVETLIQKQLDIYGKKLKEDKEFRTTLRICKVVSKPRLKSFVIETLPVGFEVTVLQVNHKWVYVSYFSPDDNLPQTGWIMRKYLYNPQK